MPIKNIVSVMKYGLLSNTEIASQNLQHASVALQDVQDKRDGVTVPNGLALHDYANLYFDPRNPMMYLRCAVNRLQESLCVLVIDEEVMHLPNVVLTDRNASCDFVQFLDPSQIDKIDFDKVYASDWRHPNNPSAYYVHRKIKCAEVLVPKCIPSQYIKFAHVVNDMTKAALQKKGFMLDIEVTPDMFFC
jgi:ssDNA thymidine ADP-ribosyltransferase DarT-like protein